MLEEFEPIFEEALQELDGYEKMFLKWLEVILTFRQLSPKFAIREFLPNKLDNTIKSINLL